MTKKMYNVQKNAGLGTLARALFLLVALLLGGRSAQASHMAGADLTYEYIGNGQYRVVYTLYRDCAGIPAPTSAFMTMSSAACNNFSQSVTLNAVAGTGQEISYACPGTLTTCQGGTAPGFQQWEYEAIVTLPAQCPDWTFQVSDCCRNAPITTITNPDSYSLYIEAKLNNTVVDNTSPTFTNVPVTFLCIGQDNYYNHGVIDAEGDSLAYFFIPPRDAQNDNLAYEPGYSIANPITSSPAVSIDPVTGDIFTHPTATEIGVIAVLILEYRNGVLIGSVMRDLQVYTVQCNNTLPTATGINGTTTFLTSACAGGQICFDVITSDPDVNDTLTMTWNNGIPGATFTVGSGRTPVGTFCWSPGPGDARPQPYTFTVTVRDNACPSNGVQTYSYSITVGGLSVAVTSTPSVSCFGDSDGSASASASGISPFTYLWSPGGETTSSVSGLAAGSYSVTITDSTGCSGTRNFTIAQPLQLVVTATGTTSSCTGGAGEATASVTGGTPVYDYSWNTTPVQTTETATNLAPGTYTVTVTDNNQCSATATATVTGTDPIIANLNITPATCNGNDGAIEVIVTSGTGPYTYVWNPNVSTGSTATGLIPGMYDVTVTDANGCIANLSGTVNSTGINAFIVSQTDATCSNGDDGSATVGGSGGTAPYSYLWMPNGDTTATVNNLAPGTYDVAVSDYFGCTAYVTVVIGSQFQAPVVDLGADVTGCIGSTVTLDAGAGFASYLWNDNSTAQTLDVTVDGTYSVLVTDANGCENFDAILVNFIQCQQVRPEIEPVGGPGIDIFPNPGRNRVMLSIPGVKDTEVSVTVRDIIGNTVSFSKELAGNGYTKSMDIRNLPAGIYTVNVSYGNNTDTIRLVKE
jgi:hypothetical protein